MLLRAAERLRSQLLEPDRVIPGEGSGIKLKLLIPTLGGGFMFYWACIFLRGSIGEKSYDYCRVGP